MENVAAAIALAATDDRAARRIHNVCEEPSFSELEWAWKIAREMGWEGEFVTSSFENLTNSVGDLLAIFDLVHDPHLHVVHDQSQSCRMTDIVQRLRNIQSECPLHNQFHLKR